MKACCESWLKEQFGDDAETIAAVYAEYLDTMAELERDLTTALAAGDAPRIDRILHTIKGSAGMAGDAELSALADRIRKQGGTDGVADVLAELRQLK